MNVSRRIRRLVTATAILSWAAAVLLVILSIRDLLDEDPGMGPWWLVAIFAMAVGVASSLAAMLCRGLSTVEAAFEIGYEAGLREGLRHTKPTVVDLTVPASRRPEPTLN